jgi:hypothetical protein
MMFFDYTFRTAYDGSIIFDEELRAENLQVKEGGTFVVRIVDNKIILEKQHGHS